MSSQKNKESKKTKNEIKEIKQAETGLASKARNSEKAKTRSKKAIGSEGVSRYLKAFNPYFQTLEDPFNVHGVKIPDAVTYPSATFSITDRRTLTVSTAGVFGIQYGGTCESANFATFIPSTATGYLVGQINGTLGTTGNAFATGTNIQFPNWNATTGFQVPALYTNVRLVSAGLSVIPTGAPLTLKGKISAAFFPRGQRQGAVLCPITDVDMYPGSVVVPGNSGKGVTLTYTPQDIQCLSYVNFKTTLSINIGQGPLSDVGTMIVVGDGFTAGDTVQCVLVANYEGLPATNALSFISATPSRSDPISLATAQNMKEDIPAVQSGVAKSQGQMTGDTTSANPMQHHPEPVSSKPNRAPVPSQEKGMIENILETVLPLAEKALPAIAGMLI